MDHGTVTPEIAKGLLALKKKIAAAKIPPSKLDETINIATWNIREFGKEPRSNAAIHYVAEILCQFDLVSIVELRDNLDDLKRVLELLGPYWRIVYSDMIPDRAGNRERIAYLYDKRAVVFTGLAAEANPPREKKGEEYHSQLTWWRSPYLASFRAGNFDFIVVAAHIQWGTAQGRKAELKMFADWMHAKGEDIHCEDKDMIVMGDFNIENDTMLEILTSRGLKIPDALARTDFGTNLEQNKRYDQILHMPIYNTAFSKVGGVLDFVAGDRDSFYEIDHSKFTYELSDHLPLWIQVKTDISSNLLHQIIDGQR